MDGNTGKPTKPGYLSAGRCGRMAENNACFESINSAMTTEKMRPANVAPLFWLAEHFPQIGLQLGQVTEKVAALAHGDDKLLGEAAQYAVTGAGKRLRPALVLLAAQTCGEVSETVLDVAAVLELIHTASLVHDDVLDESVWRRGKLSARARWGNRIAVLLGDTLLSRAFIHLERVGYPSMTGEALAVVEQMCRGQIAEIAEASPALSEERYLEIVADKTASLLGLCGRLGACCAGAPAEAMGALETFGYNFGLAFQITDDIQDLIGSQKVSGKPVNHDLRQRKLTLPLIAALRQATGAAQTCLQQALAEEASCEEQIATVRQLTLECGGIHYAQSVCEAYLAQAHEALVELPQVLLLPTGSASAQAYQTLLLACSDGFPLPVMA